ncbi:hypothetical protein HBDW_18890 [Herbaspirillum sp. DW155]|uniref:hypothetical protein n=1 Tax=Herbaspirillum sp. DW155 TaxID=3095609 RepID=UPI003092B94E|nr:hypothetical protein HBDW_18890 [Herbaspirillum sp. DW155]
MDITIKIDIEKAIAGALAPEKLAPILDKHVTEAITSAISTATGYNSDFRKVLTEQLKDAMPHGLALDDMAKFQHILNDAISAAVSGANNDAVRTAIEKSVIDFIQSAPSTIKLSEFMELVRDGLHVEGGAKFYAYLDSDYGVNHLYLDKDPAPGSSTSFRGDYRSREDRKYSAAYSLAFNKEGEVYALKLDDKVITPASLPNAVGSFHALLMSMYVGRTVLLADIDDDEIESLANEQYDD